MEMIVKIINQGLWSHCGRGRKRSIPKLGFTDLGHNGRPDDLAVSLLFLRLLLWTTSATDSANFSNLLIVCVQGLESAGPDHDDLRTVFWVEGPNPRKTHIHVSMCTQCSPLSSPCLVASSESTA